MLRSINAWLNQRIDHRPRCPRRASKTKSRISFVEVLERRQLLTSVAAAGPGPNWVANSTGGTDTFNVQITLKLDTDFGNPPGVFGNFDTLNLVGTATVYRGSPFDSTGNGFKDMVNLELVNLQVNGVYRGFNFSLKAGDGTADLKDDQSGSANDLYSSGWIKQDSQNSFFASTHFDIHYQLTLTDTGQVFPVAAQPFDASHIDRFVPFGSTYQAPANTHQKVNDDIYIVGGSFVSIPLDSEPVATLPDNGKIFNGPTAAYSLATYYHDDQNLVMSSLATGSLQLVAPDGSTSLPAIQTIYPSPQTYPFYSDAIVIYTISLPTPGTYTVRIKPNVVDDTDGHPMQAQTVGMLIVLDPNKPSPTAGDAVFVLGSSVGTSTVSAPGILANDTGAGVLTVAGGTVTGENGGTFKLNADGSFSFTPSGSFPGFDRATYTVADAAGNKASADVTVLSHTGGVVWKFYEAMLDREPDDGGLSYWIGQFNSGAALSNIAEQFFDGPELQMRIIKDYYLQYLGRHADLGGLQYWMARWAASGPEDVQSGFADSPEFTQQNGNTPSGWVTGLYEKILQRTPDGSGLPYWTGVVQQIDSQDNASFVDDRAARNVVALGIIKSAEEYENIIVPSWFEQFVQRQPSAAELAQYAGQLPATPDRTVEKEIIDQAGAAADVPTPPAGIATALPDFYYVPLVEQPHPASINVASIGNVSPATAVAAKDAYFFSNAG